MTARCVFEDGVAHLDVRGLPAPQPMVAILSCCAKAPPGASLVVSLDRDPVFLYPELAEQGWVATRIAGDADEVLLRVERVAP